MRKKILAVALTGLTLPALALAAQPVFIRVTGRNAPMREVVQVIRTANGPVRVRTWSWRGPRGAATLQVSESRGAGAAVPSWALAQMRAAQRQMQQMRLIQAALEQRFAMSSLPLRVMFGQPLLVLPGQTPPVEVRFLQPMIRLQAVPLPTRVIVLLPQPPNLRVAPHGAPKSAPARHHGGIAV